MMEGLERPCGFREPPDPAFNLKFFSKDTVMGGWKKVDEFGGV